MGEEVEVKVGADTKEAQQEFRELGNEGQQAFAKLGNEGASTATKLDGIEKRLEGIGLAAKGMLVAMGAQAVGEAFGAFKEGVQEAISEGLKYNQLLEDSRGGLAALLLANYELKDANGNVLEGQERVNKAFEQASDLQTKLAADAQKTSAEYGDLVTAFQVGLAPAVQVGIKDLDKLREVMLAASQAAKVLGVEGSGLAQEMGALFRFEAGSDNKLASALQLNKDKLKELKAAGVDLADFLMGKLKPYSEAAAASMGNFSVSTSNLMAAIKELEGQVTKPMFDVLSKEALDAQSKIGEFRDRLKGTDQDLAQAAKNVIPLAEALAKLATSLAATGASSAAAAGPTVKALTAIVTVLEKIQQSKAFSVLAQLAAGAVAPILPLVNAFSDAEKAVSKFGMAASHVKFDDLKMQASHAAAGAKELSIEWSKAGDSAGKVTQMGGTLAKNMAEWEKAHEKEREAVDKMNAAYDKRIAMGVRVREQAAAEGKSIGQLVEEYNKLNAAQEAAFKKGDTAGVEEARIKMSANLVAQADATARVAQAAQDANIALGALNTTTVDGVQGMERLVTQTLAVRAAQEQLNTAWREGLFQLQGIAWETRKATEKTVELTEAQKTMIEELAKVSDANPSTQLWVGRMIWQLEQDLQKGKGSVEEFKVAIQELFRGLQTLSASAGQYIDLTALFTQLNQLMLLLDGQDRG